MIWYPSGLSWWIRNSTRKKIERKRVRMKEKTNAKTSNSDYIKSIHFEHIFFFWLALNGNERCLFTRHQKDDDHRTHTIHIQFTQRFSTCSLQFKINKPKSSIENLKKSVRHFHFIVID